ncbi:MAG: hypothetical protein ABIS30_02555 [Gallionella sp.]|jgi:hypothetical protein
MVNYSNRRVLTQYSVLTRLAICQRLIPPDLRIRTLSKNQWDIKNKRFLITVLTANIASFLLFPKIEAMAFLTLFFNHIVRQHFSIAARMV